MDAVVVEVGSADAQDFAGPVPLFHSLAETLDARLGPVAVRRVADDAERGVVALGEKVVGAHAPDCCRIDVHECEFGARAERLGVDGVQRQAGNVGRNEPDEGVVEHVCAEDDAVDAALQEPLEDRTRQPLPDEDDVPSDLTHGEVLEDAGVAVSSVLVGERNHRQDGGRRFSLCHGASVSKHQAADKVAMRKKAFCKLGFCVAHAARLLYNMRHRQMRKR